ncbi:MAG: RagB/SusD family nutrient uptake outer membrane protein [Tannerellaceae bacterium]|nr:RagB/SusD family nutrient uptake outer membrane protein [Tannerellaceae bacterium]
MKIKIITLAILSIFVCTSCEEWLDVTSEGTPNESGFWQTDEHYTSAAEALYVNMGLEETWGRDIFWEQGASDDVFFSRERAAAQMNLANFTMDGVAEGSIKTIYSKMYETIAIANNLINHALQIDEMSDVIKNRLGEAYFMRAFSHFMIAYRYGRADNGVPFDRYEDYDEYITKIPEQRATVMENYGLIIEDLDKAAALLPWFNKYGESDYGRASKDAAIALKVKTYAYWAQHDATKWSEIPSLVDQLENEGGRGLLEEFKDVFLIENNWSKEYIWSVNSSGHNFAGSIFPGIMLDYTGWDAYNGWGNFKPTLELWAEYDDNDKRRPVTILQYGDEFLYFGSIRRFYSSAQLECGFHFNKYMEPYQYGSTNEAGAGVDNDKISSNGNRPTTDLNVPLIRFAEMLLFKAEALIETGQTGEAAKVLNRITTRAGLGEVYTDATIEDLMHERRCELAGEYTDRVMDLKRWAVKYAVAKEKLQAAKHGLKYVDRSDPDSPLDTANGTTMTINGKTYNGVIEIHAAKTYNPEKDCVLPYEVNEVIKAQGALKQNQGYPSN